VRLRNIRDDFRIAGHGFVEAFRPAKTRGEDDPGASGEFDVAPEHVEGLIHQAYGEHKNFEPVDAEAKKAVDVAQAPAPEPEPVAEPVTPAPAPVPAPPVTPAAPAATEEKN
jgi:hypothetical protein